MMIFSLDCKSTRIRKRRVVAQAPPRICLAASLLLGTSLFSYPCDSLSLIFATRTARRRSTKKSSSLSLLGGGGGGGGGGGFSSCTSLLLSGNKARTAISSSTATTTTTTALHQNHEEYGPIRRCTTPSSSSRLSSSAAAASDGLLSANTDNVVPFLINFTETETTTTTTSNNTAAERAGVDQVFNQLDMDGSGSVDFAEFHHYLSQAGYSRSEIEASFMEMDRDESGEISRAEFEQAILHNVVYTCADDDCPRGYFLNSVQQACVPLGPIGVISQRIETLPGPLQRTYKRICNLFGLDTKQISKLGVSFALSYSIISNLNGAISLSAAWYISCKRTGLSPLVPGQWRNLLSSYAMIYGLIQILKPFRVAMAIAGSKLSAEWLEMTQIKFNCSRTMAIVCQYMTGQVVMAICACIGVNIVSLITGVPIFGVGPSA